MEVSNSAWLAQSPSTPQPGRSTLIFSCHPERFEIDKDVACRKSPVIRAAATGGFQEARTGKIYMGNYDPSVVRHFVHFLNTGSYDVDEKCPDSLGPESLQRFINKDRGSPMKDRTSLASIMCFWYALMEHIGVNAMGDYYGVEGLPEFANEKIRSLFENNRQPCMLLIPPPPVPMPMTLSWQNTLRVLAALQKAIDRTGDAGVHKLLSEALVDNFHYMYDCCNAQLESITTFMGPQFLHTMHNKMQREREHLAARLETQVVALKAKERESEDLEMRNVDLEKRIAALEQAAKGAVVANTKASHALLRLRWWILSYVRYLLGASSVLLLLVLVSGMDPKRQDFVWLFVPGATIVMVVPALVLNRIISRIPI